MTRELHKANQPWKAERICATDGDEEANMKIMKARAILNKITPTTEQVLTNEFIGLKVGLSPRVANVISIIFEKALKDPKYCDLYARICNKQVSEELKNDGRNRSCFRDELLIRSQATFLKTKEEFVHEMQVDADCEQDTTTKAAKKIKLLEADQIFRRWKVGRVRFIGHLYLQKLISVRIVHFCTVDLLKSVVIRPGNTEGCKADDASVECAVHLLETIGRRVTEDHDAAAKAAVDVIYGINGRPLNPQPPSPPQFPLELTWQTLESAAPIVNGRVRCLIMNLFELRERGWVPRRSEELPRTLAEMKEEFKKEERMKHNHPHRGQHFRPVVRMDGFGKKTNFEKEKRSYGRAPRGSNRGARRSVSSGRNENNIQIPVGRSYYTTNSGRITCQRKIAEYSVTEDLQVHNDRRNARYLCEENLKEGVNFDLTIGIESFIDKGELLQNEPCLGTLSSWAISQKGETVKEVFDGADFATWRGTLKRIASTIITHKPYDNKKPYDCIEWIRRSAWSMIAQEFGGVIFISESKKYVGQSNNLVTFSGFKFEQYMTADTENGTPDTDAPIDSRKSFEMMVRSDLVVGDESINLPIELKTKWENNNNERDLHTVLQNELIGISDFIYGIKTGDMKSDVKKINVLKVIEKDLDEIKATGETRTNVYKSYAFLHTVLKDVKAFLLSVKNSEKEACKISFDPLQGIIEITGISREEANANRKGLTEQFIAHFNSSREASI